MPVSVDGDLWLTVAGQRFCGPSRMRLLRRVAHLGSLRRAAQDLGMSYKCAWDTLQQMSRQAGTTLTERYFGGRGIGGGTALTAQGQRLVKLYDDLENAHKDFLAELDGIAQRDDSLSNSPSVEPTIPAPDSRLRATAANQFYGRVVAIQVCDDLGEIEVLTASGLRLTACQEWRSIEAMRVTLGAEVLLLVKAVAVRLQALGDVAPPARRGSNRLTGQVSRVFRDSGKAQPETAVITLDGGEQLTAFLDATGQEDFIPRVRHRVRVDIDPAAVLLVLAVPVR